MRTREGGGDRPRARPQARDEGHGRGAAGSAFKVFRLLSAVLLATVTACSGSSAMGPPLGSGGIGMGGANAAGASGAAGSPGGGGTDAPGTGGSASGGAGGTGGAGPGGRQGGTAGAPGTGGVPGTGGGTPGTGGAGASAGAGGRQNGGAGRSGSGSGGAGGAVTMPGSGGAGGATEIPPGYVPAIMAVGYGGVRIVSRDGGKTWGDRAIIAGSTGDDQGLLRAVAYGKGMWIATGWKILTSTDGVNWTDRGMVDDGSLKGCHIVEGLTYANGNFYAACGIGTGIVYRSSDGMNWTMIGSIGDTKQHVYITYRGGKFVAWGDTKTTYQSTDAITWTVLEGVSEGTYCLGSFMNRSDCHGASWFEEGFWLNLQSPGLIVRSTDGKKFDTVFTDDRNYTLYDGRVFTAGYVAPR